MALPIHNEIRLLAPLTFAIVGYTTDNRIVLPLGTGFFVAPYVGITAKHVVEGLWSTLALPWKQDRYPNKPVPIEEFRVRLFQLTHPTSPRELATWDVTGTTRSGYTDIAFLNVVPDNQLAETQQWPEGFLELRMEAPPIDSKVSAVGYPGMNARFIPGEAGFTIDARLLVEDGIVVEDHKEGRGTFRFPHFETTARFEHGLSGAPVVHGDQICGVVSYASSDEVESYAATLWPLLLQETPRSVDPRQNNLPLLDLLRNGAIRSRDWRDVEKRAFVDRSDERRPMARLRRIVMD